MTGPFGRTDQLLPDQRQQAAKAEDQSLLIIMALPFRMPAIQKVGQLPQTLVEVNWLH